MSIHNRLGPCLLHLNRWFPRDIVKKILRMAGPCAVQMALLAHNRNEEKKALEYPFITWLDKLVIAHGEIRLFRWICKVKGVTRRASEVLPIAASAGNVEAIKGLCSVIKRGSLKRSFTCVVNAAAEHGKVNVLDLLIQEGLEAEFENTGALTTVYHSAMHRKYPQLLVWLKQRGFVFKQSDLCVAARTNDFGVFSTVAWMIPGVRFSPDVIEVIAENHDFKFLDRLLRKQYSTIRPILIAAAERAILPVFEWAMSRKLESTSGLLYPVHGVLWRIQRLEEESRNRFFDLTKRIGIEIVTDYHEFRRLKALYRTEEKQRKIKKQKI